MQQYHYRFRQFQSKTTTCMTNLGICVRFGCPIYVNKSPSHALPSSEPRGANARSERWSRTVARIARYSEKSGFATPAWDYSCQYSTFFFSFPALFLHFLFLLFFFLSPPPKPSIQPSIRASSRRLLHAGQSILFYFYIMFVFVYENFLIFYFLFFF